MKIKAPTKINLNGFEINVVYFKVIKEDDRLCGQFTAPNTVEISLSEHSSKASLMSTIAHELHHAVFDRCGLNHLLTSETEECIVRALEHHLYGPLALDPRYWVETKFIELSNDKE